MAPHKPSMMQDVFAPQRTQHCAENALLLHAKAGVAMPCMLCVLCMLRLGLPCRETVRKVERLHLWDVARANKSPFAFGIEPRVPFLDKAFLQTSMTIDPQDKMVRCLLIHPKFV